jgi:hypothetical protein
MKKALILLVFSFLFVLPGCDKDKEFEFNVDDLTETRWGIPDIIDLGPDVVNYDLSAPTIFSADGKVTIGPAYVDYWTVRDSRSIFIHELSEVWFIIELKPETLYVEKSKYPTGNFIMRCMYRPMGE